jgi:hypothetical protein
MRVGTGSGIGIEINQSKSQNRDVDYIKLKYFEEYGRESNDICVLF